MYSPDDETIKPPASAIFSFFAANTTADDDSEMILESMGSMDIYVNDTFGLQTLDKRNQLYLYKVDGINHSCWSNPDMMTTSSNNTTPCAKLYDEILYPLYTKTY